jgi:ATP-dependent RNA helicase DDX18/HAS1
MMRVLDRPSPSFLNSARETRNRGGFAADDADDADEERSANINAMSEDEFEDWVLEGLEDDLVDSRRQNRSDNGPYGDQNDEAREYVPTLLAKYVEDDFEPEMFVREPDDPDEYFFYSGAKFKDIGASELIVNALESRMNISRPSHIQAQSFKILLHDHSDSYDEESSVANDDEGANHVLLADQAGSGKTLSYLLPLLQRLERLERDSGMSVSKRPRALVLVPTSELARQVTEVVKELSKGGVRTRSMIATGGASDRTKINRAEQSTRDLTAKFTLTQTKTLKSGVDIVIGTPGRIRYLCETGRMELDDLDSIILDECDVLLGDAFEFASQIKPIKDLANPTSTRFVLVTATIPDQVLRELKQFFYPQDIRVIQGPGLHRPSAGTLERLVDCSGGDVSDEQSGFYRKYAALMKILRDDILPSTAGTTAKTSKKKSASRTLLFCNKIETCRKLENLLIRSDPDGASYKVLPYHAALSREKRDENLRKFLGRRSSSEKQRGEFTVDDDDSTPQLLICTDRASRGLDGKKIKHVVLFDFPRDPSEYVRRVGRTARGALGTGTVTALVIGRQLKLAREIMRRNSRGDPVEGTPTST